MANASLTARSEQTQRETESRSTEEALGDLVCHLKKYAQANPASTALWCVGIGFVLGWKLKLW